MNFEERIPWGDSLYRSDMQEPPPFFAGSGGKAVSALLMVVIIAVILVMRFGSGTVSYEMDNTKLAVVCCSGEPLFIPYDSIRSTELVTTFQLGAAVDAVDWEIGWNGLYENDTYGLFTLYAYSTTDRYIVVEHQNGILIFSDKTGKATEKAYQKLLNSMEESNDQ